MDYDEKEARRQRHEETMEVMGDILLEFRLMNSHLSEIQNLKNAVRRQNDLIEELFEDFLDALYEPAENKEYLEDRLERRKKMRSLGLLYKEDKK